MLQMLMDKIRGVGRLFSDKRRRESDRGKPSRRGASRRYRAPLFVVCKLLLVAVLLNAFAVRAQTNAIVGSGLWNIVSSMSGCNNPNLETFNLTYANGAYSATHYEYDAISPVDCARNGPQNCAAAGFYLSGQDLLSVSQFGEMLTSFGRSCWAGPAKSLSVSFLSPDSVLITGFDSGRSLSVQMTRAASTPTTAIVASGLWNVVVYYPYCNYTELGTFNLTYANGVYSVTTYTSNRLGLDFTGKCQNIGAQYRAATDFYQSGQDLLSTSQFQAMLAAMQVIFDAAETPPPQQHGVIQPVNFTSPDSVAVTIIDPEPFGSFSFQMTRASSAPTSYTLAVTRSGSGTGTITSDTGGIDCGTSCWADYTTGTSVTLTATPASGSFFTGWSGDCSGSGSCSVTMNATRKVIATFKPKPFIANTITSITAASATITTTIDFNAADQGKQGSVFITGWVPTNGLGALGISTANLSRSVRVTATSDNPYLAGKVNSRQVALGTLLAAADPNAWVLVQKTASGWALVVNGQLIPYVTGTLGSFSSAQSILYNTDPSALPGAQFCVGYGTSDTEMIVSGRMLPVAIIPDANGNAATNGSCNVTDVVVVEFYNANINHYFMTASLDEAVVLDNKTSWGWARTGKTFNVWLNQATAPGSASPVCRFYGVFANGTVGSHFYTADPVECAYVKGRLDWGWGYENDAFYAAQPTGSSCPSGTSPVYRVYNNGMGGAPNHRYMANQADVATMVAQGWVSEGTGTAFCGAQ